MPNADNASPTSTAGAADAAGAGANANTGGSDAGDSNGTPSLTAAGSAATPGRQSPSEPATPSEACVKAGQLLDFDALYEAISADLRAAASTDARFLRYLTLSNRFNSGCNGPALEADRQALTKLVNMLSLSSAATAPLAIDPERTIYRLDERNYRWNRSITVNGQTFADLWEAAIAANPFAVEFTGTSADSAKAAAGTTVPVMFADSFLDTTATGDLYYASIGVTAGGSIDTFIATELGIDVASDLANGTQIRAGTTKSRVLRQDVLVQGDARGAGQGRLWQSFSVDPNLSAGIFAAPLGLQGGSREAIFSLPNGMMAFLIADATGNIALASDVLVDAQQNDLRAIASVSCSSCHADGLISVIDEVAPATLPNVAALGLDSNQVQQLQDVYRAPAEFSQAITSDNLTYQAALGLLQLPTMGADPVAAAFSRFDRDLSLSDAAGDLGVTPARLRANLNLLAPALAVLGTLTLDRDDFAQFYVDSLCNLSIVLENQPTRAQCDDAAARAASAP